jgi:3-hydroxyisobutyrate dehydrogenase-like beta-hydroxyacid dehydrogenase
VSGTSPHLAFVGFGSFAASLAEGARAAGVERVSVWVRPPVAGAEGSRQRVEASGLRPAGSLAECVRDADVVVAAVPWSAAAEIAHACAEHVPAGALYVDPAPGPPDEKRALAELLDAGGAEYVDAAVLGTVEIDGARVPLLVSGTGARRFTELGGSIGLRVTAVEGEAGRATLVKLLRSVYMKGRDALILEMLIAARRHGLEGAVLDSIGGPGETVPFPELAGRVLRSLALYSERRAEELSASGDVVEASGVDPLVTRAGAERLHSLAPLELRARFGGVRPGDLRAVLDLLDDVR